MIESHAPGSVYRFVRFVIKVMSLYFDIFGGMELAHCWYSRCESCTFGAKLETTRSFEIRDLQGSLGRVRDTRLARTPRDGARVEHSRTRPWDPFLFTIIQKEHARVKGKGRVGNRDRNNPPAKVLLDARCRPTPDQLLRLSSQAHNRTSAEYVLQTRTATLNDRDGRSAIASSPELARTYHRARCNVFFASKWQDIKPSWGILSAWGASSNNFTFYRNRLNSCNFFFVYHCHTRNSLVRFWFCTSTFLSTVNSCDLDFVHFVYRKTWKNSFFLQKFTKTIKKWISNSILQCISQTHGTEGSSSQINHFSIFQSCSNLLKIAKICDAVWNYLCEKTIN